jgi:polysaccharide biosynthesis transport protein
MELRDYLAVIGRRKGLIAAITAITAGVAVAATLLSPPEYTATATLRVEPTSAVVGGTVRADDLSYLDRLENTYADLVTSGEIRDAVAERAGLDQRPAVEVVTIPNTELMDVRVTTRSPQSAARAANALAAELVARVRALNLASSQNADRLFDERAAQLEDEIAAAEKERVELERAAPTDANQLEILRLGEEITSKRASLAVLRSNHQTLQLARQARSGALSLVAEATSPTHPSNRELRLALVLGLGLGLIAAVGLAFLAENLTRRFRTGDEIERAVNSPILAMVPGAPRSTARSSSGNGSRAAREPPQPTAVFNSGSKSEEAFRRLATALLAANERRGFRTLLVTSADAGDGKTTVVANVGRAIAQSGRPVLLVDANLRSPTLHDVYGLPNEQGLSDILVPPRGETASGPNSEPPLLPTGVAGLWMLPSGNAMRDPAMLLGSPRMETWIGSVARGFDYVIFDSPAVLDVSDAATLARSVDAVVFVTRPNVHRTRLASAHRELETLGVRFLGVVVNKVVSPRERQGAFEETPGPVYDDHE